MQFLLFPNQNSQATQEYLRVKTMKIMEQIEETIENCSPLSFAGTLRCGSQGALCFEPEDTISEEC